MKHISFFLSENFQFWEVKFSMYMNRHDFVMKTSEKRKKGDLAVLLTQLINSNVNGG